MKRKLFFFGKTNRFELFMKGVMGVVVLASTIMLAACFPKEFDVDKKADTLLRMMSSKIGEAQQIAVLEERVIDPAFLMGEGLPELSEIRIFVKRPDKLRVRVTGRDYERQLYYDGREFAIFDVTAKRYTIVPAPDNLDELIEQLEERFDVTLPAADFIVSDPYSRITENITSGRYLGVEKFDGREHHHLTFREEYLDWDLWISVDRHLPTKFILTSRSLEGNPAVEGKFIEIDLEAKFEDEFFRFAPPEGIEKIPMKPLGE